MVRLDNAPIFGGSRKPVRSFGTARQPRKRPPHRPGGHAGELGGGGLHLPGGHALQQPSRPDLRGHDAAAVHSVLDQMAVDISAALADTMPVVLCVMNGAVIPAALLMVRLNFPLRLDYVHATRYRGNTSGGQLHWLRHPTQPLRGEHLLIVDDIFDEDCVEEYCGNGTAEPGEDCGDGSSLGDMLRAIRRGGIVPERRRSWCPWLTPFRGPIRWPSLAWTWGRGERFAPGAGPTCFFAPGRDPAGSYPDCVDTRGEGLIDSNLTRGRAVR